MRLVVGRCQGMLTKFSSRHAVGPLALFWPKLGHIVSKITLGPALAGLIVWWGGLAVTDCNDPTWAR